MASISKDDILPLGAGIVEVVCGCLIIAGTVAESNIVRATGFVALFVGLAVFTTNRYLQRKKNTESQSG